MSLLFSVIIVSIIVTWISFNVGLIVKQRREQKPRIYLAHPYTHRLDGKHIEHHLKEWGYPVYNPFDGCPLACHLTKEYQDALLKPNSTALIRAICPAIYEKDIKHIVWAAFVVVYYPIASTGTSQKIPISKLVYGKKVIVLTDFVHPFIEAHADAVIPLNPDTMSRLKETLAKMEAQL